VFHWLTGAAPDPSRSQQGQLGKPEIPDHRLDWLSSLFNPKKHTPAKVEFLDTPGLMPSERRDNPRRLGIMRDAGGLLIVLNGFSGQNLADELAKFREEILFADLEIVSTRADKLRDQLKKPKPGKQKELDQAELELLQRVIAVMEKGQGAAHAHLSVEEEKVVRSFQLLTLKKELVLVNLGDDRIGQPLPADLLAAAPNTLAAPAKLERELEELPEEDRKVFMEEMKLSGFSRNEALRAIVAAMGQIVFFTVGEDECRAWPIPKGATAVEGAGEIHTDLARGFVRAEVVSFADFKKHGSMKEAKQHGVYRLEGKTYVVQDGDIMHILAST
jgi:ribosome-binding ATPase YchF (GTP1/OBG family)